MAYVKCANDGCVAKISVSVVVAWDGKCPRCRGMEHTPAKASSVSLPKGYVKCAVEDCRTKLHALWVAKDPSNAVCNLCKQAHPARRK